MNFSETSTIARKFRESGYQIVDFPAKADVYVINTCSVTEKAEKKCRNIIRKAIKTSPDAKIVVVGCYSQLRASQLASIKGVDIVLGSREKFQVLHYLKEYNHRDDVTVEVGNIAADYHFVPSYSENDRTRTFLKIQDGCDYHCAYCTVPLARGRSRNPAVVEVVSEAKKIAQTGVQEIVLTGVNVGDFGKSTGESFLQLISELEQIAGIARIRLSSIEPNLLNDRIIDFVALSEKFMPHFHLPLQSGADKVLKKMRRRYDGKLFAERIEKIRNTLPLAFIGVDVIVGFPGETDNDFSTTYHFLHDLDISYLHVFPYSDRPGTTSFAMADKTKASQIKERAEKLTELSNQKNKQFYQKNIGQKASVLFEEPKNSNRIGGFTENYLRVESLKNLEITHRILPVSLNKILPSGAFEAGFL